MSVWERERGYKRKIAKILTCWSAGAEKSPQIWMLQLFKRPTTPLAINRYGTLDHKRSCMHCMNQCSVCVQECFETGLLAYLFALSTLWVSQTTKCVHCLLLIGPESIQHVVFVSRVFRSKECYWFVKFGSLHNAGSHRRVSEGFGPRLLHTITFHWKWERSAAD